METHQKQNSGKPQKIKKNWILSSKTKMIVGGLILLIGQLSLAEDCAERRSKDLNPGDVVETILNCKLVKSAMREPYSHKACFSIVKLSGSNPVDHFVTFERIHDRDPAQLVNLFHMSNKQESLTEGSTIEKENGTLVFKERQYSFEFGTKWLEVVSYNARQKTVSFETFDIGIFSDTLTSSETFQCQ